MSGRVLAHVQLEPEDNQRLAGLCGPHHQHINQVAKRLDVNITNRGHDFYIRGQQEQVTRAEKILRDLYCQTQAKNNLTADQIHLILQGQLSQSTLDTFQPLKSLPSNEIFFTNKSGEVKPYTNNQKIYLQNILSHDINFCIGPAGTGKTYLAVAAAVDALEKDQIQRLLLVRPAVEAGENLGFLPGDLMQKIEPYLRPLYDGLFSMLGFERVQKLIAQGVIEIAPLAYMRGRTLNDAFVILDESQNSTGEQMKMFLTRIGFGTKAVITGDITQIDLPRGKLSGLIEARQILQGIKGISFTDFTTKDVVRHNLVQKIVEAYDAYDREMKISQ